MIVRDDKNIILNPAQQKYLQVYVNTDLTFVVDFIRSFYILLIYRSLRETSYSGDSFSSKYNYYDGTKHLNDYLYESTRDVLGNFKHYNLSAKTLNIRNMRSRSPLVTRELDRYFERKSNYIGDTSAGCSDFRHYNYRRTPYFGGSDDYS